MKTGLSVAVEKPESQPDTAEGKEAYLFKRLANTYLEYLGQVYGDDDFLRLTNLALEQESEIFMSPSRELRSKRVETRFQHSSKEPTQIKEAAGLSLPQYAVFSKYKKYFQGEKQTLPFLIPNERFYKLKYEGQTKIISEIEATELFVKEDLSRIDFPETATDRMLPQDTLSRIHPALRKLADKDPEKIKTALQEAAANTQPLPGSRLNLIKLAEQNTQKQLDSHLGAVDDNPLGEDLLNPILFAEALTAYRAKYGGVLFTDKEIVDRLKKQKEHEFKKKFEPYLKNFLIPELEYLKNKRKGDSPDKIAEEIKKKLEQDLQEKFHNCVPLSSFAKPVLKEFNKLLKQELLDLARGVGGFAHDLIAKTLEANLVGRFQRYEELDENILKRSTLLNIAKFPEKFPKLYNTYRLMVALEDIVKQ